jgi:hypothetical protein
VAAWLRQVACRSDATIVTEYKSMTLYDYVCWLLPLQHHPHDIDQSSYYFSLDRALSYFGTNRLVSSSKSASSTVNFSHVLD